MADLVVYPHCDLHVALHGAPPLKLTIWSRIEAPDHMSYVLSDVTATSAFDFFAPYNPVGNRFQQFVTIDPATGIVTPTAVGINLVQIRKDSLYIVVRIQVHDTILGWWFGNASITTALDANIAHAQPSIYALFTEDAYGTDLVGDITGHGYVPLTTLDPAVFTVNAHGRLQGHAGGTGTLSGTFLGTTHTLPVRVVDYGRARETLDAVQVPNIADAQNMHNMVFLAEGFRDTAADRAKFDEVVAKVADEVFSKERHAPYNLLGGSFNVWKAYEVSQQHGITCAFRVNDADIGSLLAAGYPIPHKDNIGSDASKYTPELLIGKVGLPLRNETRNAAQLIALWNSQSLGDFDATHVDDDLITVWKGEKSLGLLEARDTFFGLHLGSRYADRASGVSSPVVTRPANEAAGEPLRSFIKRVYEWFTLLLVSRLLTPDPRRHPPELHMSGATNNGNSILKYLSSLSWRFPPHPNIGQEWVPDPAGAAFKRSRGFVAIVAHDGLIGGANFNNSTMTSSTIARAQRVKFQSDSPGNERIARRIPPDPIDDDLDDAINTVTHEFGHSFNLLDEYEEFPGGDPDANRAFDSPGDNIARLGAIFLHGAIQPDGMILFADHQIDPAKVKWFDLLRMEISDRLIKDSETQGASIKVTIDKRFIGAWAAAKQSNLEAYLRSRVAVPRGAGDQPDFTATGQQLPLHHDDAHYLVRLVIGDIDEAQGTILLGGPELPPPPFPVFPKGSFVFVPRRDKASELMFVVEKKVLEKLTATQLPLNQDTDTTKLNTEADDPVDISGFKPPCKSYKLIGVYEGGERFTAMSYRPTGLCKMRKQTDEGQGDGEFCHVCKYLIVQRVDPGLLALLDKKYYPTAKKNG